MATLWEWRACLSSVLLWNIGIAVVANSHFALQTLRTRIEAIERGKVYPVEERVKAWPVDLEIAEIIIIDGNNVGRWLGMARLGN